jgi:hypothetical protein
MFGDFVGVWGFWIWGKWGENYSVSVDLVYAFYHIF